MKTRVRLLRRQYLNGRLRHPQDVVEVSPRKAARLIEQGKAKLVPVEASRAVAG